MTSLGYSSEVAAGVVKTLQAPEWGLQPGGFRPFVERLAGRWEVGEDAGLKGLAMAVEREVAQRSGRAVMPAQPEPERTWPVPTLYSIH